jgi:hypothetical protein
VQVYSQSGLQELREQLAARGPEFSNSVAWLSYQLTPRASIFRRDAASIETLKDMRRIMRSNDFMTDKVGASLKCSDYILATTRGPIDICKPGPSMQTGILCLHD